GFFFSSRRRHTRFSRDWSSDVCSSDLAWLHVDGAMAGAALLLPECRPLAAGIGSADSIVINAHKWIGAVFDCSLFFTRRPEHLVRLMSTSPSYLRTEADHRTTQFRVCGIA